MNDLVPENPEWMAGTASKVERFDLVGGDDTGMVGLLTAEIETFDHGEARARLVEHSPDGFDGETLTAVHCGNREEAIEVLAEKAGVDMDDLVPDHTLGP